MTNEEETELRNKIADQVQKIFKIDEGVVLLDTISLGVFSEIACAIIRGKQNGETEH